MRSLRHHLSYASLAVVMLSAACGNDADVATSPGDEADPAVTDTAEGPSSDDLEAACGSVRFDSVPADTTQFPPLDEAEQEIDLSPPEDQTDVADDWALEMEFFQDYEWRVASSSDDELVLFGIPNQTEPEGPAYAEATFERQNGTWEPAGWGQCDIQVGVEGWGNASFVLDPDQETDPGSTNLAVQATEMACAGGQVPEGREVASVVVDSDAETVAVLVLVEPLDGGATCQSSPSFPLEVDLGEPLGDRTVLDASVDPAVERPWPPEESSPSPEALDD